MVQKKSENETNAKPVITKANAAQEVYNVQRVFTYTTIIVMVSSIIGLFLAVWFPFISLLALTIILVLSGFMFNQTNQKMKDLEFKYGCR